MSVLTRGFQVSTWVQLGPEAHEMHYELDRLNERVCIHFDREDEFVLDIGADDLRAIIALGQKSLRELAESTPDES